MTIPLEGQPPVTHVEPRPSMETWLMGVAGPDMCSVVIKSVSGQHVSFMDPDAAISIGRDLIATARRAKSGLIVPQIDVQLPPPNGDGHSP